MRNILTHPGDNIVKCNREGPEQSVSFTGSVSRLARPSLRNLSDSTLHAGGEKRACLRIPLQFSQQVTNVVGQRRQRVRVGAPTVGLSPRRGPTPGDRRDDWRVSDSDAIKVRSASLGFRPCEGHLSADSSQSDDLAREKTCFLRASTPVPNYRDLNSSDTA